MERGEARELLGIQYVFERRKNLLAWWFVRLIIVLAKIAIDMCWLVEVSETEDEVFN